VVVNKMDTVKWAKSIFLELKDSIEPILKKAGFQVANTQFIPLSASEGHNMLR
jgi:translation elongation factor EF-1alpha